MAWYLVKHWDNFILTFNNEETVSGRQKNFTESGANLKSFMQ
jgi:hypothetical protein